ncbi:MAG: TolC family protein [Deltaproteobacteria bacterium]|nr:TolC family protein [Deltaproteobacteria bacterium]
MSTMRQATGRMSLFLIVIGCSVSLFLWLPREVALGAEERSGAPAPAEKTLTLAECVRLALETNRTVQIATLDRTVQRFVLKVAEDKFMPHGEVTSTVAYDSPGRDYGSRSAVYGRIFPTVSLLMPTGSQMNFTWLSGKDSPTSQLLTAFSGQVTPILGTVQQPYGGAVDLSVRQPLLKGGGITVNKASVNIARSEEERNKVALKSTIMDVVTSVIVAYRRLQQTLKEVQISRQALAKAQELLSINQTLVKLGRLPALDIVQTERNVTSKELALVTAERDMDAARLALIDVLEIDPATRLVPTEALSAPPVRPDLTQVEEIALRSRPEYLQARFQVEVAEQDELLARNNRLWDFSLIGGYTLLGRGVRVKQAFQDMGGYGSKDWRVGVELTIPLRDLTLDRDVVSTRIAAQQARLRLEETRHRTAVAVRDAVRDVEVRLRQNDLARKLRDLSEKQFSVEQEKLHAGRSSIFQLVSYQDDLLDAQLREVEAAVGYLNALTVLDQVIGTTLETWQIDMRVY